MTHPPRQFRLRTLGRLALAETNGREEPSLATRPRKLALLAWLALRPEHRATRDRIIGVFWGDRDEARARNSLSDALSHLRRVLGRDALRAQGSEIILDPAAVEVDALALLAAAGRGDHARAVDLHSGPFLDGFYINDAPEFEEWRDRIRARVIRAFVSSAAVRCAELAATQSWAACRDIAERWLEVEPESDEAAQVLARALREAPPAVVELPPVQEREPNSLLEPTGRWRRPVSVAAACIGVVAIGLAMRHEPRLDRHRVVVTAFENLTGDSSFSQLGAVAADWVSRGLAETHTVEVADPLMGVHRGAPSDPRSMGRAAQAGIVVIGSYVRVGDSLAMSARLVDANTGDVIRTTGTSMAVRSQPLVAVSDMRERVFGALASEVDPVIARAARGSSQPPNYEAYLGWVEGLELFARNDYTASIKPLLHASALDSTFISPRIWAMAAYGNIGDWRRTDSLLQTLWPLRDRLGPVDRGLVDVWAADIKGDRTAEYVAAHRMLEAAPGSELSKFIAGLASIYVNRPREAVEILRAIPVDSAGGVVWDMYGTELAHALHLASRHDEELTESTRRLAKVPGSMRAMADQARALIAVGRVAEAMALANRILESVRDPSLSPGSAAFDVASELRAHGHPTESRALFRRIADWARTQSPTQETLRRIRLHVAAASAECGDYATADSVARLVLADAPEDLTFLRWFGIAAARRADTAEARRTSDRLASLTRPYMRGTNTQARAEIAAALGEKAEATQLLRQALAEGVSYELLHTLPDLLPLRGYAPFDSLAKPTG